MANTISSVLRSVKYAGQKAAIFFETDTANFQRNSDRQLKISDSRDHRCSEFRFRP